MPHQLKPPDTLADLVYFGLRFNRDRRTFELGVPSTGNSYDLGSEQSATEYFKRVGQAALGTRAMDAARSFGMSQALVREQRAWGMDLIEADPRVRQADDELTRSRLFGEDDDNDDVAVVSIGVNNDEKVVIA